MKLEKDYKNTKSKTYVNNNTFLLDCTDSPCTKNSKTPRVEYRLPYTIKKLSFTINNIIGNNFIFFQILEVQSSIKKYVPILYLLYKNNSIFVIHQDFNKTYFKKFILNSNLFNIEITASNIYINNYSFEYRTTNITYFKYGIYSQDTSSIDVKKITFNFTK